MTKKGSGVDGVSRKFKIPKHFAIMRGVPFAIVPAPPRKMARGPAAAEKAAAEEEEQPITHEYIDKVHAALEAVTDVLRGINASDRARLCREAILRAEEVSRDVRLTDAQAREILKPVADYFAKLLGFRLVARRPR